MVFLFKENTDMKIEVNTKSKTYPIWLERGILSKVSQYIGKQGHVFLISDDGVPQKWQSILQNQYPEATLYCFKNGEGSKNFTTLQEILRAMQDSHISRKDTVIALGGGVCGDMAGFAASIYMRGIPYINIPTTTLSQIDSSIGGKTAIDFNEIKNSVGAFHQPDMVFIDPDVLSTLSLRHYHNGLAEAVKEGMLCDPYLFHLFEKEDYKDHIEEILERCLRIKKQIVEEDEKENGKRMLLNFGHTFGHAYESYFGMDGYYHGECVAMGMMTIVENPELKQRLANVLHNLDLPTTCDYDPYEIYTRIVTDKKADHDHITIVQVDELGKGSLQNWTMDQLERKLGI